MLQLKFFLTSIQCRRNNLIHVIIFIFAQATAKNNLWFYICHFFVLCIECTIFSIVDRIVRLITRFPLGGIFSAYDSFWLLITVLILTELKPLMLDDAGPRRFAVGIVDRCITLKIRFIQ